MSYRNCSAVHFIGLNIKTRSRKERKGPQRRKEFLFIIHYEAKQVFE